jgi:beta-glucosidase
MRARFLIVPGIAVLVVLHLLTRPGNSRSDGAADGASGKQARSAWLEPYTPPRWDDPPVERTQSAQPLTTVSQDGPADWLDDFLVSALDRPRPRRFVPSRAVLAEGEALFRQLDLNGDGILDREEMPTTLRLELNKWDADTDRLIELGEFLAYFSARVEQAQTSTPNTETTRGRTVLPPALQEMLADSKGQIALYEWKEAGGSVEEFRKLDRNGDGFITPEEKKSATDELYSTRDSSTFNADPVSTSRGGAPAANAFSPTGYSGGSFRASTAKTASTMPATTADQVEARHISAAVATMSSPQPRSASSSPASRPAASPQAVMAVDTKVAAAPDPAPAPPPLPAFTDASATEAIPLNTGAIPYWTKRNAENDMQLLLHGHANVLFLGDSITDLMMTGPGKPVWNEFFAPLNSEDFAVSGATTSQVLWQVETGRVALASPDVVVLMIGTNNLAWGQSAEAVTDGIARIVSEIHAQLPATRILLLGIFPRAQSPFDPMRARVAEVNAMISTLQGVNGVTYLDIGRNFLQPNGTISPAVMPDYLHPSLLGYDIYTISIWNTLIDLLLE